MLPIIQKSKWWYAISGLLILASIGVLAVWKLNFGIDFTGGSLLAVEFQNGRPEAQKILETLKPMELGEIVLQNTGERGVTLRFREVDEVKHKEIAQRLAEQTGAEERRFETIGGIIGKELKRRSMLAIVVVLAFILLFIAWSFRGVSRPVSSWRYGVCAIIALFHDVIIVLGVASVVGHFFRYEIGASFIAAVLTVLAYSVSDTIVVYDRIRENLFKMKGLSFADMVNTSINQTMHRSINTSLTIILSLAAIFVFGGESTKFFSLTLMIGIFFGTYSSIFIASPILATWQKRLEAATLLKH